MDADTGMDFYHAVAPFSRFAGVVDPANYEPLPEGWVIGVSDVVNSTGAIAQGRYKAVNMVGASVISAVRNALSGVDFPFVFGGDGASFALPRPHSRLAAEAMAAAQVWARGEIGLELRAGMVPMSVIREAGHEVLVGRYAPSPHVTYAMFSGGGVAWAEREMKAGRYLVPAAVPGARPDLDGLSCRWSPMAAERGVILSVLVLPEGEAGNAFRDLVGQVLDLAREEASEGRPLPAAGPTMDLVSPGMALESRVPVGERRSPQPIWKLRLMGALGWALFKTGFRLGGFDPSHYLTILRSNSDFRKFDDGLKLTLDCSERLASRLEGLLKEAKDAGVCRYGVHRQTEAIMTCIVPSVTADDHIHFIDGATGGYAAAASQLKARSGH